MPRCKQAKASATPPIPAPIMEICGNFSVLASEKLIEEIIPKPLHFKHFTKIAFGKLGSFWVELGCKNLFKSF